MKKSEKRPKVLVIVGPTASGKTGLAVALAKQFNGEVISADSRQVYKGLDIGTAKVTEEEMQGVSHHLIDVAEVKEVYSAADFVRDGQKAIADIISRDKLPIIAGGTFFYVDALLGRTSLPQVEPYPELRAELERKSEKELFAMLEKKDPHRASEIDQNNKRRLIRALEITHELEYVPEVPASNSPYNHLIIGIETEKEELREKFAVRAEQFLQSGFLKEIEQLHEAEVSKERLLEIGFEYQIGLELFENQINEEEFVEKFIAKNWQYAKRQMTWLQRDQKIKWFKANDPEIFILSEKFLKS